MIRFSKKKYSVSGNLLLLLCALAFMVFYNDAFFRNLFAVYPVNGDNLLFLVSAAIIVFLLTGFLLVLAGWRYTTKPFLMILFPCTALANYFMNSYNIVIDTTMIQNTLETDLRETGDLFSIKLLLYVLFWGVLPSLLIYFLNVRHGTIGRELIAKASLLTASLVLSLGLILLSSEHFATFFRENKILRYYTNPLTYIYSGGAYLSEHMGSSKAVEKQSIGMDAHIPAHDSARELTILVVGETARADHFSLNGYERDTNPLLQNYGVTSFSNVTSCATTTAISVPCMFALAGNSNFDIDEAGNFENLLDVLSHAGVATLWRDNNSDSKGVARDEIYEDFRNPDVNPVCDVECRDIGMLEGLDAYIAGQDAQDIVIILHQMGNHGPAYFKRYPEEFKVFTPVCETNQLESCTQEEINNAYDNAILYTDYFLANVIDFLKGYDDEFKTAMIYMSDHGESLGEHSLFLHGLPNFVAPEEQRNIPAIFWLGENHEISNETLKRRKDTRISHDNLFHTVLGLMELETAVYDPSLDILHTNMQAALPL